VLDVVCAFVARHRVERMTRPYGADSFCECREDRRVEITGPVNRKMMINGMNSGAKVLLLILKLYHHPQSKTRSMVK
jgi:hypothetical protein